ncbi:MAG TPA: D-alanyl-D-alanine carboxypeptidase family protein [Actinomycetota bacterium]|nr:D-alanyl-D-alanine carboxypeptidase family protein [Actinomycetota bacterium]
MRRALIALGAVGATFLAALLGPARAQTPTPAPEPPPPTPVLQPNGQLSPSPFPQALRTPAPSAVPPRIDAAAAVLADLDTGRVLFDLNGNERRPIASITKIMTALLVIEETTPTEVVTTSANAASGGGFGISGLGLETGERIRVQELLYALMLQSANDAAIALAEHVAGTEDSFVRQMNGRARDLDLRRTRFASPNGLDDAGYSSARDLARLTRNAFEATGFASVVATRFHTVRSLDAEPRMVQNRNALLWLYPDAIGVKTGFTTPAGFCIVAAAERDGRRLVAVVLGEPGEPFSDAAALLNYGFEGFEQRVLVPSGTSLDAVEVSGRKVAVTVAGSLERLVPVDAPVSRTVVLDQHVPYPPPLGSSIGVLRVSVGDLVVGTLPLLVAGVPPPPEPESGSWWSRSAGSVFDAVGAVVSDLFG